MSKIKKGLLPVLVIGLILLAVVCLQAKNHAVQSNTLANPSITQTASDTDSMPAASEIAGDCAADGAPCADPNNTRPQPPLCSSCCSGQYSSCDGLACICGPRS
jgi:hypothetical protein